MNNCVKNVALVGVVGGFAACNFIVAKKVLESDDCREFIVRGIFDRIETALFGDRPRYKKYGDRVSYRAYYDEHYKNKPRINTDDIVFETRDKANKCLENMLDIVDKYGIVTAADIYDLVGITPVYTDNKYVWTYEQVKDAEIVRLRSIFKISLPKPSALRYDED